LLRVKHVKELRAILGMSLTLALALNIYSTVVRAEPTETIKVTIDLDSNGKWITCYIELPEGYNVEDIDIATVLLDGVISAESKPTKIGDYDEDKIPDLKLRFDGAAVIEHIRDDLGVVDGEVTLTVTGKVAGTSFEGTDMIKVVLKSNKKSEEFAFTNVIFVRELWPEAEDYRFEELRNLEFNTICLGAGYWTYDGKIELHNWAKAGLQSFALRAKSYGLSVQAVIGFTGPWEEKYDLSKIDVNEPVRIVKGYPALQGINNDMEKIASGDEAQYIKLNNQMAALVQAGGKIFTMDSIIGPQWYPLLSNLKIDTVYYMMYMDHPLDESNFKYGMQTVLKNSGSPAVILMKAGDTPSLGIQLGWIDDVLENNSDLPKPVGYGVWSLDRLTDTEKQSWRDWISITYT